MLRIVVDTNLFVSSLLVRSGIPAQILQKWRQRVFLLVISPAIIAEIRQTLSYKRIRRKYKITGKDIDGLISLLEKDALVVPGIADVWGTIADDPDDDHILACAIDGQAHLIVSGDSHLLSLGEFRGIQIMPARKLLDNFKEQET